MTCDKLSPDNNTQASAKTGLDRLLTFSLLLVLMLAASRNSPDPDLWGHVQYGRDVLRDGLPATSSYSYTASGFRWINHENLTEILFAAGMDWIGPAGMLLIKSVLGTTVLWLLLRVAQQNGVGQLTAYFAALLTAANLMLFWNMRPHTLSYALFGVLLWLLSGCFAGWEGKWQLGRYRVPANPLEYSSRRLRFLWAIPALIWLWTNTHGGFVAGLAIFAVYLACRAVEALACRGRHGVGLILRFAMMVLAAVLVTVLNPYGLQLHRWLAESLGTPRPEIAEWLPPTFSIGFLPFWITLGLAAIALFASRRPRDFTHCVILLLAGWQAMLHQRHIPLFALLVGFWLPVHFESAWMRWRRARPENSAAPAPRALQLSFGALLLVVCGWLTALLSQQLSTIPVKRSRYPVAAFQFMADQQLGGRIVVAFPWAQYAIMAFGNEAPSRKLELAFDGRFRTCYPQQVVDLYFDFEAGDRGPERRCRSPHSPPPDPSRILRFREPDLVLIEREREHCVRVLAEHSDDWTLLYQDALAQLWGRKSRFDDRTSQDYLEVSRRRISDAPQVGYVAWPALPVRSLQLAKDEAGALPGDA